VVPPVEVSEDIVAKKHIHLWTVLCIITYVAYVVFKFAPFLLVTVFPDAIQEIVDGSMPDNKTIPLIFFLSWIAYLVCYYFYLRWLWKAIPGEFARTTPGKAALLMLIPVFNWYWQFVAFVGLYKDMNKLTESDDSEPRFNESLIEVICFGWLVIIVFYIVSFSYGVVRGFCNKMSPGMSLDSLDWLTTTGNLTLDNGIWILMIIVATIVTATVYWIIRKDVMEFIDIKSSMEK
jgi:hypothetical protein